MKFATTLSIAFATGVLANPSLVARKPSLVERDLATITNVVNQINSATQAFDTAVKGYNGGDTTALLASAQSVLNNVTAGTQTVQGTSMISTTDALTLQGNVQTLNTTTATTINDLIGKKQPLVAAGQGGTVESNLQQLNTAAQNFAKVAASKVPQELQSLAQQLTSGITASIQQGINAFQGTGGSAPSGSGSSPSSTGSSGGGSSPSASGSIPSSSSSPVPFKGAAARNNLEAAVGGAAAMVGFAAFAL